MEQQRVRLGELLVAAKIITPQTLQEVLTQQARDGRKLGALLVSGGYVSETEVTQVLSQQLSVPWVSLHHIDFSRQLLNLVERELAERHCLIPIYVRRSRHQRETLYIAMDDPTDVEARAEVELYAGLPVKPMIAPPTDIRAAIRVYYGGESLPLVPSRPSSETPPEPRAPSRLDEERKSSGPVESAPFEAPPPPPAISTPVVSEEAAPPSAPLKAREVSMPAPKAAEGFPKMVTLTLLDGTQLKLPAAAARAEVPASAGDLLTARDLVAALRAHASGADVSQVLGSEINWQRVCAALLSVLLRKQLVADWEFVDELRR